MKTQTLLLVLFSTLWGTTAHAQPNPIALQTLDSFSLAHEVVRNRDLRLFLKIEEDTNDKVRDLLRDATISASGKRIDSIQTFGPYQSGGKRESVAKLDAAFLTKLKIAVPGYKAYEVRIWAVKVMFPSPELAFTSPKVHQYLELDQLAINSVKNALESERIPFEDLRNRFRLDRAKAIIDDLPFASQVLFTRYAGSELLKKFEYVAEEEGPLEFKCYALEWPNTMVNLSNNLVWHKRLELSPHQLAQIKSIETKTIDQIFSIFRNSKNVREEQAIINKQSYKEMVSVLTERQTKRLQQSVALEFFVANPKRELAKEDFRSYLGLNEKKEWESTLRLIENRDSELEIQLAQLNAVVAAKLMSALPAQNRVSASELFEGVW